MKNDEAISRLKPMLGDLWQDVASARMPLYLFGGGSFTKNELLPILLRHGIRPQAIIDRDAANRGRSLKAIPFISYEEFKAKSENAAVMISAPSAAQQIHAVLERDSIANVIGLDQAALDWIDEVKLTHLTSPIQLYVCSPCPTNCATCCYGKFRTENPSLQVPHEDIAYLAKNLSESNYAVSLQLVGGEPLVWKSLVESVKLLDATPNVISIDLYTAGCKGQLERVAPIIDHLSQVHFSQYNSNKHHAEEMFAAYPHKVLVHEIPEHTVIDDQVYPLEYPVECLCPSVAYMDRQMWLCSWIPLNLGGEKDSYYNPYRLPVDEFFRHGMPSHWVHGKDPRVCDTCTANNDRNLYAQKMATP